MYSEFLDWGIMLYEREFGFYVKIKFQKNLEFSFYAKNVVWSLWLFLVLNFCEGNCQMYINYIVGKKKSFMGQHLIYLKLLS